MSREIKFRAWEARVKKYIDWDNFINNPFGTWGMKAFNNDRYHFQQYTGLKDKHGRKIYEGDLVLRKGFEYEIKFEIGSFMLVAHDVDMYQEFVNCWNDNVYPLSQLYWENGDDENWISDLEVIGNKYEGKLNG